MAELTSVAGPVAQDRAKSERASNALWRFVMYALLALSSLSFLLPLLWMLSTSLKDTPQTYHVPPILVPWPMRFQNYPEALVAQPFATFILNTVQYAVFSGIGAILSCSLVAYGFSRIRWHGRDVLFFVMLATMMIPFQVRMVPLYITFRDLHWLNSYKPLIVPAFFGSAYFIFLLRQFFMSLPRDLEEAATIDCCGLFRIFTTIILPLSKPALATLTIFTFMGNWQSFYWPLIMITRDSMKTLPLGLLTFMGLHSTQWTLLMAGSLMMILPMIIVFLVGQKWFISGIQLGALKG